MSNAVAIRPDASIIENVLVRGDLSKLSPQERADYYGAVCRSVGLNPITQPFAYITLNGKLTLYALRACTDQLRSIHKVSVVDMTETERDGVCIVTCKVADGFGRTDMAKGAVNVANLKGEALANAFMKAETKAKRRATLSICGLSLLDETEVEDIKRENPHVNRTADIVDVVAPDDPDHLPAAAGIEARVVDQRADYEKLQKEMRQITDPVQLQQWGATVAKERMGSYKKSWQDTFRREYWDYLQELRAAQKPADAPVDGPDAADPEGALKWIDEALTALTDPAELEPFWNRQIGPCVDAMLPPDQEEALGLFRKHEQRLAP